MINYRLFKNGIIHTLENDPGPVNCVLTSNGRIIYAGDVGQINFPDTQTKTIDLQGRHLFPAFTDTHTHFAAVAMYKKRIALHDCHSLKETLTLIKSNISGRSEAGWITGGGWDANAWPNGMPHRKHLDAIEARRPMAFYSKDGHAQWLNTPALKLCGLLGIKDEAGGMVIGRDEDDSPNGLVYEKACRRVDEFANITNTDELAPCLDETYPEMYRLGITSVHSCEEMDKFRVFQYLSTSRKPGVRICMHPPAGAVENFIASGIRSGFGNEWLRIGGMKFFVDGSLGSQTAEMFEPLTGQTTAGVSVFAQQELTEKVCRAAQHGLASTIHAIGDKANDKALTALEAARGMAHVNKLCQRIEHAQIIRAQDIERFAKAQIIASMQPMHISDDVRLAEKYLGKRQANAYPIRSLIEQGVCVAFGSDMPVADPDPLKGILAAVTRKYKLDENEPRWQDRECISARQALLAYTRNAAYASGEENLKGSIRVDKLADFVVLNENLESADEESLRRARVEMTVLNGEIVYRRESFAG